jgi:hypothetical protein
VAAALAPEGWAREAGLDFWNLPADRAALDEAQVRSEELDHSKHVVQSYAAARFAVVDDLIAGRVSLAGAASEFADLNRQFPGRAELVSGTYPSASEEASAALQAVEFTRKRLRLDPDRAAEVVPRLEAEYRTRWGGSPAPAH